MELLFGLCYCELVFCVDWLVEDYFVQDGGLKNVLKFGLSLSILVYFILLIII